MRKGLVKFFVIIIYSVIVKLILRRTCSKNPRWLERQTVC